MDLNKIVKKKLNITYYLPDFFSESEQYESKTGKTAQVKKSGKFSKSYETLVHSKVIEFKKGKSDESYLVKFDIL